METKVKYEIYSISWGTDCRTFKKVFDTIDELKKFYNVLRSRKSVRAIFDTRVRRVMSDYRIIDTAIEL